MKSALDNASGPGIVAQACFLAERQIVSVANFEEKTVLVLQGGGALGAYQAGAYTALAEAGYMPSWVAGISIGAINSAIIAGNPPERRVERLRAFWEQVSSRLTAWPLANDDNSRKVFNETSAALAALWGVPGFFEPRVSARGAHAARHAGGDQRLRHRPRSDATLEELVDFDLLNSGEVRVSVGAVEVLTGNMQYFDTTIAEARPRAHHGERRAAPWLSPHRHRRQALLGRRPASPTRRCSTCSSAAARARICACSRSISSARAAICRRPCSTSRQREKEIRYSSRTRLNTDIFCQLQAMRRAIRRLRPNVPDRVRRQSALAAARPLELRCRHHHRAADSPPRRLLDAVQRLRVLALHDGGALVRGPRRRGAHARSSLLEEPQAS